MNKATNPLASPHPSYYCIPSAAPGYPQAVGVPAALAKVKTKYRACLPQPSFDTGGHFHTDPRPEKYNIYFPPFRLNGTIMPRATTQGQHRPSPQGTIIQSLRGGVRSGQEATKMTVRSVTVRAAITRSAKYQSVSYEVTEHVDLAEGEDRDEAVKEIRQRLFASVDEVTMRGIVHVANQEVR